MDLQLKNKLFLICGASSGFGFATLEALVAEKANVIAVARNAENLKAKTKKFGDLVTCIPGDITDISFIDELLKKVNASQLDGVLVNAGGPKAMKFEESSIEDWDEAYKQVVRWKIYLTQKLIAKTKPHGKAKFIYVESASVKQPIENLILSTSMRLSIVGMVKTISQELAKSGLRFNILGPGYHATAAVNRLITKKAKDTGSTEDQVKANLEASLPLGATGDPGDFGKLAAWMFSSYSNYMNGLVIPVDGGSIMSTL